tara:strand:+ start:561 stop:815 length:255 start_codon:yes stop_codon:yes gene_type:complete
MKKDELEAHIRRHIETQGGQPMNVFLSLCQLCDLTIVADIVLKLPEDTKVGTVGCGACGAKNSSLMFHMSVPYNQDAEDSPAEK